MTNTSALAVTGLDPETIIANILSVYERSSDSDKAEGASWYFNALETAKGFASLSGVTVEHAVAVIAHMSPRLHWSRNKRGAEIVLTNQFAGGFLNSSVNNAKKAISSNEPLSTLNGQKVKAFAANILGDNQAVTIDVWMMRVAFGNDFKDSWLKRKGFYDALAECFRIAANKVDWSPSALQGILWLTIRGATG